MVKSTILFDKIVFGPIRSRRLGSSLGVNLLPPDGKLCSFDCIYCECGLNKDRRPAIEIPSREQVKEALEYKLALLKAEGITPDSITFAGNGEPTMHPEFGGIIDDTIALRNEFFPETAITVFSNATMLDRKDVFDALNKVDNNVLKIDSVSEYRIRLINVPNSPLFTFDTLLGQLMGFKGNLMIQTMFLKGEYKGEKVDNTTEEEITGWIDALKQIQPKRVMIYTIERETPVEGLRKVDKEELEAIAERLRNEGFDVQVAG